MTNIAQIANVLQSMILTKEDKMVLTPTYHVFEMYKVHQDATYLPLELNCERKVVRDDRIVLTFHGFCDRSPYAVSPSGYLVRKSCIPPISPFFHTPTSYITADIRL